MIKKLGGQLKESYLDEVWNEFVFRCNGQGFLLDKKIGVNQPRRIENASILIANTPMDTDKVKVSSLL